MGLVAHPRKGPPGKGNCCCRRNSSPNQEGTPEVKRNRTRPGMKVTTGAKGVVAHAGARLLCDLSDALGLSAGLSAAMAPTKQRRRGHDRGDVLVDLAVMIADGGEALSDLAVL